MFIPLRIDTVRLRFPLATVALVAAMAALYAYSATLPAARLVELARAAGAVPYELAHGIDLVDATQPRDLVPPPFTVVTSWFLHGDPLHVLGNLWFLWLFGGALEGRLGSGRFLALFAGCGLVAAAVQVAALPSSTLPMIGASGAIAGLLGAYAHSFPRARAHCLVFLLCFATTCTLPAAALLALWLLVQLVAIGGHAAGVAFFAHVGGFAAGLVASAWLERAPRRAARRVVYHARHAEAQAGGGRAGAGRGRAHAPVPAT